MGDHHKDGCRVGAQRAPLQQFKTCRVDPVGILEQKVDRSAFGKPEDLVCEDVDRALLDLLWREVQHAIRRFVGQQQEMRDQRDRLFGKNAGVINEGLELFQPDFGIILAIEPGRPLDLANDRVEGAIGVIGRTLETQAEMRRLFQKVHQFLGQARLADPRFAGQEQDLAFAVFG